MGLLDQLRGRDHPRVTFIGVDGVPFVLPSEHPDEFPNFAALADTDSAGGTNSIVPPESSARWPVLTTGVNPGETGVYGFQDREVESHDTYAPMGRDVQATRVRNRITDAGRKATMVSTPVTFPPQRSVQCMVSDFLSPGVDKAAYPGDFRDVLSEMNYKINVNAKPSHDENKTAFMEDVRKTLDRRYKAFERYIDQDDWNLFFSVFITTDRVSHFLFKDYECDGRNKDAFMEFYRTVDDYLDRIRDVLPEDVTLIVASNYGFTSLDCEVHCNTQLEENNWLSYENDDHDALSDINEDSKTYSLIPGRFFIDLEGREPRGSIPQSECEDVRDGFRAELGALEGPDGNEVADRVIAKEDASRGDHDDIAPDLVVIPNHGFDLKFGLKSHDDISSAGPRNGMHPFDNAALYANDPGAVIKDTNLYSITLTILDLMDIEYSRTEFDGASLIQQ